MFNAKSIRFQTDEEQRKDGVNRTVEGGLLALDVKDKNGVEYHDLDILAVRWPEKGYTYPMLGVIRYHGGRFEVVCPWKAAGSTEGMERFIMGLSNQHEIRGNYGIEADRWMIDEQLKKPFNREGGILG